MLVAMAFRYYVIQIGMFLSVGRSYVDGCRVTPCERTHVTPSDMFIAVMGPDFPKYVQGKKHCLFHRPVVTSLLFRQHMCVWPEPPAWWMLPATLAMNAQSLDS